jgi:hypothetical protein
VHTNLNWEPEHTGCVGTTGVNFKFTTFSGCVNKVNNLRVFSGHGGRSGLPAVHKSANGFGLESGSNCYRPDSFEARFGS